MQKSSRSRFLVLASAALLIGLPFAGCTLITEVDRSLIPDGQAGSTSSGGSSSGGSDNEGGASASGGNTPVGGAGGEGGSTNEGGAGGA